MTGKSVYFIGSIHGSRFDQRIQSHLVNYVKSLDVNVFYEYDAYADLSDNQPVQAPEAIHDRNVLWIDETDGTIAEVTAQSTDVGYKIHRALSIGKPVLTLFAKEYGMPPLSPMIAGADRLYPNLHNFEYVRGLNGINAAKLAISSFIRTI